MANPENLRPPRSTSEARERGTKGGIASGKARRRKKAMKQMLSSMLAEPLPEEAAKKLKGLGVDPEDANYQAAVGAALIKKAMGGHVGAIQLLANLTGDDPYVKARQEDNRIRKAELEEKKREYDLDREDRKAEASGEDDLAAAWLDTVIGTDPEETDGE